MDKNYDKLSLLSRLTFSWVGRLLPVLTHKQPDGTFPGLLPDELNVQLTQKGFDALMARESSIFRVFVRSMRDRYTFVLAGMMMAFIENADAIIIMQLTRYLKNVPELNRAVMRHLLRYILAIVVTGLLNSFLYTTPFFILQQNIIAFRANMIIAIVKRVLTLNSGFDSAAAAGHVANLVQLDCSNLIAQSVIVINIFYYLFLIISNFSLCFYFIGWSFFSYIGVFLVLSPLPFYAVYKISFYDSNAFELKDRRTSLLMIIFSNIRFIKFNVLENFFVRLAHDYRKAELGVLRKIYYAVVVNSMVMWLLPGLAQLAFAWTWLLFGTGAKAEVFMSSLKFFGSINRIFGGSPWTLQGVNSYRLIFRRFGAFFGLARPGVRAVERAPAGEELAVELRGSFGYANEDAVRFSAAVESLGGEKSPVAEPRGDFRLIIDLRVRSGETVFVAGKIGSGKSSLVRALLGDLRGEEGSRVRIAGRVAYCPQTPFVLSKSVRDNIVFYRDYKESAYAAACRLAHLDHDLRAKSLSSDKELIENGFNISGGQRMRINLARCFYEERELYLLDDPFSSLDLNVGHAVFEGLIAALEGKTKIIITHAASVLRGARRIVYLDRGEAIFDGDYDAFLETPYAEEVFAAPPGGEQNSSESEEVEPRQVRKLSLKRTERLPTRLEPPAPHREPMHRSVLADDVKNKRQLPKMLRLLHKYYGMSGFFLIFNLIAYATLFLAYHATEIAYEFLSEENGKTADMHGFLRRYSLFSFAPIVIIWLRFCLVCLLTYRVSKRMMEKMLLRAVHGDLAGFFDKVSLAELSTRFSSDLDNIDTTFDHKVSEATLLPAYVLVDIAVSCGTLSRYTLVAYLFYLAYCLYLQHVFVPLRSDLNAMERQTVNPVVNLIYDCVKGAGIIANFGVADRVVEEMRGRVNEGSKVLFAAAALHGWFESRVNYLNVLVVQTLPMLGLLWFGPGGLLPRKLLMYLLYAMGFGWNFMFALQALCELETSMKSLERCDAVLELPAEPGYAHLAQNTRFVKRNIDGPARLFVPRKRVSNQRYVYEQINTFGFDREIFHSGRIVFERVCARYAPTLPPVLRDFSLVIEPGRKVGICGKTGSGKSTLIKLLSRYLQPESGRVTIDDYDLAHISLKALRSEFVIVNQEITLFQGTLRENLNPEVYGQKGRGEDGEGTLGRMFDAEAESEITDKLVELGFKQDKLAEAGLDLRIDANGENLSPGERQLVVFFRAMCSDRRIVILDEATSSVDVETEKRLMDFFLSKVQGKTVIIIAHRINTILNCDQIVVMQAGEVRESGSPEELLDNPRSLFKEYYDKTIQ